MTQWTDEQVAEQFRRDIRERFEKECAAYLAQEREEIAAVKAQYDAENKPHPDWLHERPSFLWEIYEHTQINIDCNSVQAILPHGFALFVDLIEMFDGTSVAWSKPHVGATIVDGEAHVTIELILIDYWDDERHARWLAEREVYKGTTAEDLLRRIGQAQHEFAQAPDGPKRPIEGLCMIEHWCSEYFQARRDK